MKRVVPLFLAVACLTATGAVQAQQSTTQESESNWSFSANLGVVSDYRFRGLMQTNGKPAIQGGFDINHSSGFYIGNWNSSISWLSDSDPDVSSNVEMDFYAGYVHTIAEDFTLDVGLLHYYYPGRYPDGFNDPDTTEAYIGLTYGPVSFKYSHSLTDLFGAPDSKNSQYYDLGLALPTGIWDLNLNAHVGHQKIRNASDANYTDWSLGLSRDFGNFTISLTYYDTNADRDLYTNSYGKYMGKGVAVLGISAAF